jgi:uncharacterized protein (TIGR02271 family)
LPQDDATPNDRDDTAAAPAVAAGVSPDELRVPVLQEEAHVAKRERDTERVQVRTSVSHRQVTLDETVEREEVEVRRVAVGREVSEAPAIREEGDLTIIPVLEERLVVEKRLFLIEEIHLVRHRTTEAVSIPTELRRTEVEIERTQADHHERTT